MNTKYLTDLPLFGGDPAPRSATAPPLRTMHRAVDPPTAVAAAEGTRKSAGKLKAQVLVAFREFGAMTDGELELLPRFRGKPINSVRKRRTDLCREGYLEDSGETRGHPNRPRSQMIVWRLRP